VKNFARSKLTRNKTDSADADLVAEFCLLLKPTLQAATAPRERVSPKVVSPSQMLTPMIASADGKPAAGVDHFRTFHEFEKPEDANCVRQTPAAAI
jgi:hypothetical protein